MCRSRTGASRTTRGSAPRYRRSRRSASAARSCSSPPIWGGRRTASPSSRSSRPPTGCAGWAAGRRGELLGGAKVERAPDLDHVPDGDLVMLENVRYEPGETKNDPELAKRYAALADVYVNDAFGTAHRARASSEGIARLLPGAAGELPQREVETLTGILEDPRRPLVA